MKRGALLALLMLVVVTGASASPGRTIGGDGIELSLPAGWHGLAGPGGVQAADFPLPRRARSSANLVRVPRGHVHLIVWNYGPWVVYVPHHHDLPPPLVLRKRDLTRAIEGFAADDTYLLRTARIHGETVEVTADLGPKPFAPPALRRANAVLATLHVLPPRVLHPRHGRLAARGVAVRLPGGWTGHIEIPQGLAGERLVLRATDGHLHLELVEYAQSDPPRHARLPIVLTSGDATHHDSLTFAHRVFSTGGRSFELEVTARSAGELRKANPLLATLAVTPRPWTFRSCDLSLRLPGTWRAAIRPRSSCSPVLKLRGPGVLVVVTELRPGERASGRILRRSGRRFRVEVTPGSALRRADAVLATLRAEPRSRADARFPQPRSTGGPR
ncbi:MAG TPA: hypothetical protein VJP41_08325 [Gaiellaceae bacterium]|nr:hypothetical protein [Gaiellaceae bacterium]